MKKIIFSAVQPSGALHLGNYLGAIKNWVGLQEKFSPLYQIVDYHALTQPFRPKEMSKRVFEMALDLLAVGINPRQSIFTLQSMVAEQTELAWILGCLAPLGTLERMPTYKEKAAQYKDQLNLGLLAYPVLQAADILAYKAEAVPVGEDQDPHIEFARGLARKFNHLFGQTFPEPKTLFSKTPRIMGLDKPMKKMSKSYGVQNYIALADEPSLIRKKLAKAVTDVGPTKDKKTKSPGVVNLFLLLENFGSRDEIRRFEKEYREGSIRYVELKEALAQAISQYFAPFRERRKKLAQKPGYLRKMLEEGARKARDLAGETLREVKKKIGLL